MLNACRSYLGGQVQDDHFKAIINTVLEHADAQLRGALELEERGLTRSRDDGLYRDDKEIRQGLSNSLFPGLFNHNEKYTAGLITKTIKENLPQAGKSD